MSLLAPTDGSRGSARPRPSDAGSSWYSVHGVDHSTAASSGVREPALEEAVDGVGPRRFRMGKVGRPDDMVGAQRGDGVADERVVGLGRDHALPRHVLARPELRLRHLGPEELPVLVEAVQPPGQPAGARLEHTDPETRVPLEHAVEDQPGEGEHLLHRVRRRVPAAPGAEPVRAGRRDDRARALVEDHRDVEVDHLGEEAIVIRMRHRPALHRVRPQHDRLHAVVGDGAADLGRRRRRVVQGRQRDGHEAAVAVGAQ